jgi:hypothetical protein
MLQISECGMLTVIVKSDRQAQLVRPSSDFRLNNFRLAIPMHSHRTIDMAEHIVPHTEVEWVGRHPRYWIAGIHDPPRCTVVIPHECAEEGGKVNEAHAGAAECPQISDGC